MNQTELLARVRRNAFIPANHPTYTDQIILDELNDALRSIYEDVVTIPRQGHWMKQYLFNSIAGQSISRITPRAVVGGVEKVEIGPVGGTLYALDQVTENHAQFYESFGGQTGTPLYYCIRGDQVEFLPAFNAIMTVRVTYYVRPSLLVTPQVTPSTNGLVTNVVVATRVVTVSTIPTIRSTGAAIVTGNQVDVIHPNGTFELALVGDTTNAPTVAGVTITFPVGTDVSEIQNGDFVRGAAETDWPPVPEEFHRTVADTASVKIMLQMNMVAKAGALASSVSGDLERFRKLIEAPRTRRQPKRVGARLMTRGYGTAWGRWR
jgi:hypothetical protein